MTAQPKAVPPIPEGSSTVMPWIISRDTARLLDFMKQAFLEAEWTLVCLLWVYGGQERDGASGGVASGQAPGGLAAFPTSTWIRAALEEQINQYCTSGVVLTLEAPKTPQEPANITPLS